MQSRVLAGPDLFKVPLALIFLSNAALAQDERRVVSPDGALEFHLFVTTQAESNLSRIAYQLRHRGRILIDTSFLGFDLYEQEPLLGESAGLMSDTGTANPLYHSLTARYMQNGSLARRLDVEVRVYNEGAAFRYVIGKATPVDRLLIADEATEFDLPHDPRASLSVPFIVHEAEGSWVAVTEIPVPGFPKMGLANEDPSGKILLTRLARHSGLPDVVFDGTPPLTTPWRVVAVGRDREHLLESDVLKSLSGTVP